MAPYQDILSQFQKLGYYEDSNLQESQVNKALDILAVKNAGFRQFDRDIAEELWEHTNKESSRTVKIRDLANTIQQADNILRDQITVIKGELQAENNQKKRGQLNRQIQDIINDHKQLTAPFQFAPLVNSTNIERQPIMNSQRSSNQNYDEPVRDSSAKLKIILLAAIGWLLWQFIVMFQKHHFLNLMACFLVLSIFALNYFDRKYIQFVMGFVGLSCIFDLVWVIVHAGDYWGGQTKQTQHSTLQSSFLVFVVIMTIILMVVKALIIALLKKYATNSETTRKSVSLFGYRIKLDGRPTYNPFTPLFGGTNDYF